MVRDSICHILHLYKTQLYRFGLASPKGFDGATKNKYQGLVKMFDFNWSIRKDLRLSPKNPGLVTLFNLKGAIQKEKVVDVFLHMGRQNFTFDFELLPTPPLS